MDNVSREILPNLVHVPILLFLLWAFDRKFVSPRPLPRILAVPSRMLRAIVILITCGFLAGCGNSDPLPSESGPLFALNPGHWQPSPQDLAAPPKVTDQ